MNVIVLKLVLRSIQVSVLRSSLNPIIVKLFFEFLAWKFFLNDLSWQQIVFSDNFFDLLQHCGLCFSLRFGIEMLYKPIIRDV